MHMDILMYKICGLVILHKWLCFVIVIFPESGLNYILLHNNKIYLKLIQKYNIAVFTVSSQQPPHHTTSSQRQVWFQLNSYSRREGGTNSGVWGPPKYKCSAFKHTPIYRTDLRRSTSNILWGSSLQNGCLSVCLSLSSVSWAGKRPMVCLVCLPVSPIF